MDWVHSQNTGGLTWNSKQLLPVSEQLLLVYQLTFLLDQDFCWRIQPVYSLPFPILFLICFVVKFFRYQWRPVLGDWIGIPRSPAPLFRFLQRMVTWISMNKLLSKEHRVQEFIWCPCSAIALPCILINILLFFNRAFDSLCCVHGIYCRICMSCYSLGQKRFFMLCICLCPHQIQTKFGCIIFSLL